MNKLIVILILCLASNICNGERIKRKVYILFENKKFGMVKFFDQSRKDTVYFVSLSDGIYLYGIQFTPEKKSDTVLYSKFIEQKPDMKDYRWVSENLQKRNNVYWEFPKTYIVEQISNDSARITLCTYSTMIE
jgi:hypothetical protein